MANFILAKWTEWRGQPIGNHHRLLFRIIPLLTPYDLLFPKMWVLVPNALHIGKFKTEYNRRVMSPVAELLSTFLQLLLLIRSVDAVGKTVFIKTETILAYGCQSKPTPCELFQLERES